MILSDVAIKEMINCGNLGITPFKESNIQAASIDVTLSDSFHLMKPGEVEKKGKYFNLIPADLKKPLDYNSLVKDEFILYPGKFVLASTTERIKLPNDIGAWLNGRSSIGRLGIFIQNAGWIDPGFEGQITLELFNAGNNAITLKKNTRIGQLIFCKTDQPCTNVYSGKYQYQVGATDSMIYKDKEFSDET